TVNTPIPSAVKLNANLPDELDQLLQKVLAKDPAQRPQTVRELLAQMARLPQRRTTAAGVAAATPVAASTSTGGVAVMPRPTTSSNGPDTTSMRVIQQSAPPGFHGSPPPTPTAAGASTIRTLELMGVRPARARGRFILNSHFSNFVPIRQRKLAGVVKNFTEAMDNVRGEHTHAWLQVDEHQFWLVNFSNMFALGRIKTVKSCYVWTSAIETILRWAGLANDWYVEEVECGSVTGPGRESRSGRIRAPVQPRAARVAG